MKPMLGSAGIILILGMTACGQTMSVDRPELAKGPGVLTSDAAPQFFDPLYGKHTVTDIWGHVVPAPGEDTSHGGSTTRSLGVDPPGTSGH
jgi:hypothetical protein